MIYQTIIVPVSNCFFEHVKTEFQSNTRIFNTDIGSCSLRLVRRLYIENETSELFKDEKESL